jgi:hypothetical protein
MRRYQEEELRRREEAEAVAAAEEEMRRRQESAGDTLVPKVSICSLQQHDVPFVDLTHF